MEDAILEYWPALLVAGFFAFFIFQYVRSGSLTGALLGGRIKREIGEVVVSSGVISSQTLKVHAMESGAGEAFVGVALVSKAPLAVSMMPFKLTRSQAKELIQLLERAVA